MEDIGLLNFIENPDPATSCRPFDNERKGAVPGDGGAIIVLESEESFRKRGTGRIYCEVKGFHSCSLADNIYKPNK